MRWWYTCTTSMIWVPDRPSHGLAVKYTSPKAKRQASKHWWTRGQFMRDTHGHFFIYKHNIILLDIYILICCIHSKALLFMFLWKPEYNENYRIKESILYVNILSSLNMLVSSPTLGQMFVFSGTKIGFLHWNWLQYFLFN